MQSLRTSLPVVASVTIVAALGSICLPRLSGAAAAVPSDSSEFNQLHAPILHGEPVQPGQYPEVAAIVYPGGLVACTGVLVAPTIVLTARHCADTARIEWVALDTASLDAPGEMLEVVEVLFPPMHENGQEFDVAALRLAAPASTPAAVLATGEGPLDEQLEVPATFLALGYGGTTADGTEWSGALRVGVIELLDDYCTDADWGCRIPEAELVTSGAQSDTCIGDSGGPVYGEWGAARYLVAITSRGLDQGEDRCGQGAISVRLDALSVWLTSLGVTMGQEDPDPTLEPKEIRASQGCTSGSRHGEGGILAFVGAGACLLARRRRGRHLKNSE